MPYPRRYGTITRCPADVSNVVTSARLWMSYGHPVQEQDDFAVGRARVHVADIEEAGVDLFQHSEGALHVRRAPAGIGTHCARPYESATVMAAS